ncbi:hypothetical protein NP493_413g02100 [Ridgeia piscesae]|uniref:Uncharacterized protein n=1 Tax=Ridgeia piscesae TaxID=27915 RepID=A0AAD9NSS2_RIDPI|nr:hypothetical protein NP493_413g02100 [Ridgeia piscesae]
MRTERNSANASILVRTWRVGRIRSATRSTNSVLSAPRVHRHLSEYVCPTRLRCRPSDTNEAPTGLGVDTPGPALAPHLATPTPDPAGLESGVLGFAFSNVTSFMRLWLFQNKRTVLLLRLQMCACVIAGVW